MVRQIMETTSAQENEIRLDQLEVNRPWKLHIDGVSNKREREQELSLLDLMTWS